MVWVGPFSPSRIPKRVRISPEILSITDMVQIFVPGPSRGVLAGGPLVVGWGFQPGDPLEGASACICS